MTSEPSRYPDSAVVVRQSGTTAIITHVPAWVWRCMECGWLGTGHTSDTLALAEGANHAWDEHGLAVCADVDGEKQYGHPGHRWKHVKGSDAVDECERCHTTIGK